MSQTARRLWYASPFGCTLAAAAIGGRLDTSRISLLKSRKRFREPAESIRNRIRCVSPTNGRGRHSWRRLTADRAHPRPARVSSLSPGWLSGPGVAGVPRRLQRIQLPTKGSFQPDSHSESVGWNVSDFSLTKSRERLPPLRWIVGAPRKRSMRCLIKSFAHEAIIDSCRKPLEDYGTLHRSAVRWRRRRSAVAWTPRGFHF